MSEEEVQQRPMVTDLVINEAKQFVDFILQSVPELEGACITFSWKPPLTNLPSVVIRGRNGGLTSPAEAVHMMEQILLAVGYLHNQIDAALRDVDTIMAERALALRELESRIEQHRAALSGVSFTDNDGE